MNYQPINLDDKITGQTIRVNNAVKGYNLQQQAQELLKSKEWKAAVKQLKRMKMNTQANRNAMLTAWMNTGKR